MLSDKNCIEFAMQILIRILNYQCLAICTGVVHILNLIELQKNTVKLSIKLTNLKLTVNDILTDILLNSTKT